MQETNHSYLLLIPEFHFWPAEVQIQTIKYMTNHKQPASAIFAIPQFWGIFLWAGHVYAPQQFFHWNPSFFWTWYFSCSSLQIDLSPDSALWERLSYLLSCSEQLFFIKCEWSRIKKSSPLYIIYNIQSLFNWRFCLYIISALYVLSSDIVSKVNSSINILLFIEYICKVSQNEKNTCQTILFLSVFLTFQNDNYGENTFLLYPKCIISGHNMKMTKSPMFRKSDAKHINFVSIPLYHFITSLLNWKWVQVGKG